MKTPPLSFDEWRCEKRIEDKYQSFHDEYGDLAGPLWQYKEIHYQEYLKDFQSNKMQNDIDN